MPTTAVPARAVPWWKGPTNDQGYAYRAAGPCRALVFDFTVFLLIMLPISQEFSVPLTAATAIFAVTRSMRPGAGAAAGWIPDRLGRLLSPRFL